MSQLPFQQMCWVDFFAKTTMLSGFARAIYAILIGQLWVAGGALPDNDRMLAQALNIKLATWQRLKPELAPFLQMGDGWVRQKRVTEEILHAREGIQNRHLRTTRAREVLAKKRKNKDLGSNTGSVTATVTERNYNYKEKEKEKKEKEGGSSASLASLAEGSLARPSSPGNGDAEPRRRTSDWDMEPAPGPSGQTAFLKSWKEGQQ
jgi:uncharacterized protein YdaU (DUF1376 family)